MRRIDVHNLRTCYFIPVRTKNGLQLPLRTSQTPFNNLAIADIQSRFGLSPRYMEPDEEERFDDWVQRHRPEEEMERLYEDD